jgi:hypothetical protein
VTNRSTDEVFADHLNLALAGDLETDLGRHYGDDSVFLTSFGVYQGREGARELAQLLEQQVPDARCEYHTRLTQGEMAFLEWTAISEKTRVDDGADSFLIQDGRIRVMTIHYRVVPNDELP